MLSQWYVFKCGSKIGEPFAPRASCGGGRAVSSFGPAGASASRLDACRLYADDPRLGPGGRRGSPTCLSRRGSDAQAAAERYGLALWSEYEEVRRHGEHVIAEGEKRGGDNSTEQSVSVGHFDNADKIERSKARAIASDPEAVDERETGRWKARS
jgi:hypothetical protein